MTIHHHSFLVAVVILGAVVAGPLSVDIIRRSSPKAGLVITQISRIQILFLGILSAISLSFIKPLSLPEVKVLPLAIALGLGYLFVLFEKRLLCCRVFISPTMAKQSTKWNRVPVENKFGEEPPSLGERVDRSGTLTVDRMPLQRMGTVSVVLIGLLEEWLHRGFSLSLFTQHLNFFGGIGMACVVSSLAFGCSHGFFGVHQIISKSLLALVAFTLSLYFESWIYAALFHCAFNLWVIQEDPRR